MDTEYTKRQTEEIARDLDTAINEADTGGPESNKRLAMATGKAVLAILWILTDEQLLT